ncbi:OmpA family protein [Limnobacter parvus]|uniref:OmpA family protein n=1 Tax=Limnobacter parvus TaxID=2939690 RepID=A0ABT1XKD8_9BURK|nr:OmpA family protein [Limnobacter parvus]MCR2746732.1 OmpA family protein [Limnobacter parvus]
MNNLPRRIALSAVTLSLMTACASPMLSSDQQGELRSKLTVLQNDPVLSRYAPQARADAEAAVNKVEQPQTTSQLVMHNNFVALRKIEIAEVRAREAYMLDQQKAMSTTTADARLASRTAEADTAADRADTATDRANKLAAELAALNAKPSPRGMLITLGDVLFATGQSNLNAGADADLNKLYEFMNNNPESRLAIEGHTDNVGSSQSNMELSESRAFTVSTFLQSKGISNRRLSVQGMGESSPVAGNDSASGRQLNRRVEVTVLK